MTCGDKVLVRIPLSKSVRFEIFKRDQFTCRYCGNHPPAVILHVDHVIPVALDGTNDTDNLVTSCMDCNLGKGARPLGKSLPPVDYAAKAELLAEQEAQVEAYNQLLLDRRERQNRRIDEIQNYFIKEFRYAFQGHFYERVRESFLPFLPQSELLAAASIACSKMAEPERAISYFCGVCYRKMGR